MTLLNDLQAIAHATPHLLPSESIEINAGEAVARAPIAVLAPGTGLSESFLIWDGRCLSDLFLRGWPHRLRAHQPRSGGLWSYLTDRSRHAGYERVCAGTGVQNVYDCLPSLDASSEIATFAASVQAEQDRSHRSWTPRLMIPTTIHWRPQTLRILVDVWGAVASNLALKVLATGASISPAACRRE